MNKLKQLSIGKLVWLTLGTLCGILLIIGALFFFSLRSIEHNNQEQFRAMAKLAKIGDVGQDVEQMQAAVFRQILASDDGEIRRLDKTVRELWKTNVNDLNDYQQFVDAEELKKLYDPVRRLQKAYWEQTQPVLALGLANQEAAATTLIMAKQSPAYDDYLKAVNELTDRVETEADTTAEATARSISEIKIAGDVLIGMAMLVAMGTALAVAGIGRRLKQDNQVLLIEIKEREQAEGELRWKTAFLEAQVNSSIDGILVVDPQGKKILQNERFTGLLNIPRHLADDKDDRKQLHWLLDTIKNSGTFLEKVVYLYSHTAEISRDEIELKDGTILDRYSAPVKGKEGEYYGRIWTFRDVTEQRRGEQELKQAKIAAVLHEGAQRYNFLADTIPLIIWTARPDGGLDYYNKAWFDYTGLTLEQTENWGWGAVLHPDDLQPCIECWTRSFTTGKDYEIEYRFKGAAAGTYRWFLGRASARRNEAGAIVQWVGTCTDIEDQKRTHSELEGKVTERTAELAASNHALRVENAERKRVEESLLLLSSAVEQTKESIVITDAELDLPGPRIVFVNPGFTRMTGYNEADVIGKTPRILQGPRTDRIVLDRLRENLGQGKVFEGETINYRKDGAEFNLEWQIAPLRNTAGKITHFVAIQHDITTRKQHEAKLFQSQKMETVGKLAGGIAHEFNSILTAIIGQGELLLGDIPVDSPLAKNAIEIIKAANRAATLTRQLLAYGRKQILQPEILDLNSVLTGMDSTLRHLMGHNTDVRFAPATGLKVVKADAGQMEQVIMNLVINASDAMPNGGKLMLETANVSFDEESVGRYPELKPGDYVMLAITDTGTGMNAAVKARLFEPFFTTKDVGQGTGLGLSTCYGIIKQSGGHISVYSEPGRGTIFKIYLPQFEPPMKIPARRLDSPRLPGGTETILLVEDDPALREMAVTLLRRLGYTVLAAANGLEALSLKQERSTGHIDLLFTDVVMPHMSGRELAERVRALYPHTKILFTSAYTENAIVHQGVLNPGVTLLQKPFTPSALANKLREVLDQPATPKPV